MSYCLLVKGADGSLRLLCDSPYDSRGEALDALSAQAAADLVDGAEDQVWLVDLNAVAPVVLFARSSAVVTEDGYDVTVEVEEVETLVVETAEFDAGSVVGVEAVSLMPESDESVAGPVESAPEPEAEPEVAPVAEVEAEASVEPSAVDEPEVTVELEAAAVDDLLVTASQGVSAESSDAFSDLREALARSVAQMEAERQAGTQSAEEPAEASEPVSEEADAETLLGFAAEVGEEPEAGSPEVAVEPVVEAPVVEAPEPEAPAADLPAVEATPVVESSAVDVLPGDTEEAAPWPWAAIAAVPEVIVPAVEPAEPNSVEARVDAPTFATEPENAPPQVPDAPIEPMLSATDDADDLPLIFDDAVDSEAEVAPVAEVAAEPLASEEQTEVAEELQPAPSAYVLEMEAVVAPTTVETPGYTPGSADVGSMTCDDCVWVDTCPNKDQRDPASCGSFQWK